MMTIDSRVLFGLLFLETIRERIRAAVEVTESGCWLWQKSTDGRYGKITICGVTFKTHVVSQLVFNGRIPRGYVIKHECDTTNCCAPPHLCPGTQSANLQDAIERGRKPGVTAAQKKRIRNLITRGHTDAEIARRLNACHATTIMRIRSGEIR